MTSFTRTWGAAYEAIPADSDLLSEGGQRIRNLKSDIQEREEVDHSWAGDSSDGEHKKLTFNTRGSDPSTVSDKGYVYTKDVSSKVELFWKDEDGNVVQLTSGGALTGADLVLDLSPQLGAALDTNSFAIDESEGTPVASAASPNIWVTDGNTLHLTGSDTITGFEAAPRAGAWRRLIIDAAPLFTDGVNLIVEGNVNFQAAAGDMAIVYAETTTQFRVFFKKADGTPVVGGKVLQSLSEAIAAASGTTSIPLDDTTPLISEGTEIWSQDLTPGDNTNKVEIIFSVALTNSGTAGSTVISVFRDSVCIGAVPVDNNLGFTVTTTLPVTMIVKDAPATASEVTYSARVGTSSGTWHINQTPTARLNGMQALLSYIVREIPA